MEPAHYAEAYLMVSPNGEMRILHRLSARRAGEVAYRVVVKIPGAYLKGTAGDIDIELPEPAEVHLTPVEGGRA